MIILFRPGFFMEQFYPQYQGISVNDLSENIDELPIGTPFRLKLEVHDGDNVKTRVIPMKLNPNEKISFSTLGLAIEKRVDQTVWISDIKFDSVAEKSGLDSANDYRILGADSVLEQPNKSWFTIPGFILFILVFWRQKNRQKQKGILV